MIKKILEELKGPRGILALAIILALPSFISNIFLGYIPLVLEILMYMGGITFGYLVINNIVNIVKKTIAKKVSGKE